MKGISASLTKYFYMVQVLNKRCIQRIPDLLTPSAEDPYQVLKEKFIEMYDLSNFQRAELLMALLPTTGDLQTSELMLLDCFLFLSTSMTFGCEP